MPGKAFALGRVEVQRLVIMCAILSVFLCNWRAYLRRLCAPPHDLNRRWSVHPSGKLTKDALLPCTHDPTRAQHRISRDRDTPYHVDRPERRTSGHSWIEPLQLTQGLPPIALEPSVPQLSRRSCHGDRRLIADEARSCRQHSAILI